MNLIAETKVVINIRKSISACTTREMVIILYNLWEFCLQFFGCKIDKNS